MPPSEESSQPLQVTHLPGSVHPRPYILDKGVEMTDEGVLFHLFAKDSVRTIVKIYRLENPDMGLGHRSSRRNTPPLIELNKYDWSRGLYSMGPVAGLPVGTYVYDVFMVNGDWQFTSGFRLSEGDGMEPAPAPVPPALPVLSPSPFFDEPSQPAPPTSTTPSVIPPSIPFTPTPTVTLPAETLVPPVEEPLLQEVPSDSNSSPSPPVSTIQPVTSLPVSTTPQVTSPFTPILPVPSPDQPGTALQPMPTPIPFSSNPSGPSQALPQVMVAAGRNSEGMIRGGGMFLNYEGIPHGFETTLWLSNGNGDGKDFSDRLTINPNGSFTFAIPREEDLNYTEVIIKIDGVTAATASIPLSQNLLANNGLQNVAAAPSEMTSGSSPPSGSTGETNVQSV